MTDVDPGPARRRPPDRKERILEHASELFLARGFPSVTMEDIADAAGVTARALYRHYVSKSALLVAVIRRGQDVYLAAHDRAGVRDRLGDESGVGDGGAGGDEGDGSDDRRPLHSELPALIAVALDTRALTVLWQREARYLPTDERRDVRTRITAIVEGIRVAIEMERPDLDRPHAERRAWGVSSTLTSLGFHDLTLPGSAMVDLLVGACLAAAHSSPPPAADRPPDRPRRIQITTDLLPRRERLLAVSADTFARQGFLPASITEIGRRAGIAGPGVYRYFPAKQAILTTLVRRLDDWRQLLYLRALNGAADRRTLLAELVDAHLALAVENPDLVSVSLTETAHLPDDVRESLARHAADRETTWIDCVRALRPELAKAEARILVRAATAFLDDTARTPRLWRQDSALDDVREIALGILGSPARVEGDTLVADTSAVRATGGGGR